MVGIDLGVQVDGLIAKSTFTLSEDDTTENLIKASKDAMDKGLELSGLDARVDDIAKGMMEVAESYEILNVVSGSTEKVVPITNLSCDRLGKWNLSDTKRMFFSADKLVKKDETKMEEAEIWGLGMSVSNGKGVTKEWGDECTHICLNADTGHKALRTPQAKKLFS
jgi:methionine aminopeptidase